MRRLVRAAVVGASLLLSRSDPLALPRKFNKTAEPLLEQPNPFQEFTLTVDRKNFAWIFPRLSSQPLIIYNHKEEKNYVCGYVSKDKTWGVIGLKDGSAVAYSFHDGTIEYDFKPFFYGLRGCSILTQINFSDRKR